jgi:hypothetical protein
MSQLHSFVGKLIEIGKCFDCGFEIKYHKDTIEIIGYDYYPYPDNHPNWESDSPDVVCRRYVVSFANEKDDFEETVLRIKKDSIKQALMFRNEGKKEK